jgi:hypothetical protein
MKKLFVLTLSFVALISFNSRAQDSSDLINLLMSGADVSETQAKGGAGALFEMAKEKLPVDDFSKVAAVVPGMDNLLAAVPGLAPKRSMLGAAAIKLSGNAKVLAVFKKLGIDESKVALFTPILVSYIENKGGKELGGILAGALK